MQYKRSLFTVNLKKKNELAFLYKKIKKIGCDVKAHSHTWLKEEE